jgi:nucleoside 2-deoxyribosyltransferase
MRMKLYLAGPLFSLAERRFNEQLAAALRGRMPSLKIVLPQARAKPLLQQPNGLRLVFEDCLAMIDECECVLAILDGADADSGTCVELGYAWARKKRVVGVRTDFRISEEQGLNLMVANVCRPLLLETSADLDSLAVRICAALNTGQGGPNPKSSI